jgi:hypothetical protein
MLQVSNYDCSHSRRTVDLLALDRDTDYVSSRPVKQPHRVWRFRWVQRRFLLVRQRRSVVVAVTAEVAVIDRSLARIFFLLHRPQQVVPVNVRKKSRTVRK